MNVRKRRAVAHACRWLAKVPLASPDIERQLQRLFALNSASVFGEVDKSAYKYFEVLASTLPSFDYRVFSGDPITAAAVQAAFSSRGLKHESLSTLASAYAEGLKQSNIQANPELTLLAVICNLFDDILPSKMESSFSLVNYDVISLPRKELMELCRKIILVTACGKYPVELGALRLSLPCLSVACARDWDLELVSWILRVCAFLKLDYGDACVWSTSWLLDQQHMDGRFGLLAPEAHRAGGDPSDWRLHFELTAGVIWTLAELEKPGFMLSSPLTKSLIRDHPAT